MKQAVIIKPYDFKLPSYFRKEKNFLNKHLGRSVEIHHTGSSAVPSLGGKNIIDITLLTFTKERAKKLIKKLESIGYIRKPKAGDKNRIFFNRHHFQGKKEIYIVHIHLMWKTSNKYKDYLLFRDHLRQNPEEAKKYYALKKVWAKKTGAVRHRFPAMKTDDIKQVLKKVKKENFVDLQNLKNKKVVVMGLGLLGGGVETVKWLVKKGAKVLVTDLKKKGQLKESIRKLKGLPVKYILGRHREQDFLNTDLIIKNPAVSQESKFLKIARKHKIPIESDLSIFFRLFKGKIIGVTGTKGKSTTVTLIAKIFKKAKKKFIFGGNIGQSPLNYLDKNYLLAILEISSWQLEDIAHLKKSPEIACVTTIFPDHLDRYKNFQEYIKAKKLIFKFQKKEDLVILNYDSQILRKMVPNVKSRLIWFSSKSIPPIRADRGNIRFVVFVQNKKIFLRTKGQKREICSLRDIKIIGQYHLENILAATAASLAFGIPPKIIKKAIRNFKGLPNRLELIKIIEGVKYYNDTTATIPEAAIRALNNFPAKKVILISGGADKKLNFKEMAKEIKKRCKAVILLPGTATKKIEKELRVIGYELLVKVRSMKQAVKLATKIAERDDVVLLSPGCASFGIFQNAYERAKKFIKEVKKL